MLGPVLPPVRQSPVLLHQPQVLRATQLEQLALESHGSGGGAHCAEV